MLDEPVHTFLPEFQTHLDLINCAMLTKVPEDDELYWLRKVAFSIEVDWIPQGV